MAQPREEIKQVKRLINSMLDEGQTPEQMQQLMTLLDHDPEACEAYLDFMMMHGSLQRQWGGSIAQVPGLPSLSSPVIRPIRRFSLRRHILAATLLILGSLFGVLWARWYHHKTSTPAYVATLTHAIDAKWIRSMPSTAPGTLLKQGTLLPLQWGRRDQTVRWNSDYARRANPNRFTDDQSGVLNRRGPGCKGPVTSHRFFGIHSECGDRGFGNLYRSQGR